MILCSVCDTSLSQRPSRGIGPFLDDVTIVIDDRVLSFHGLCFRIYHDVTAGNLPEECRGHHACIAITQNYLAAKARFLTGGAT